MRSKSTPARNRAKKRLFRDVKGMRGARANHYRTALQARKRAEQQAYEGRKLKKREYRRLWITRINIAARAHGLAYSRLIAGLHKADIRLDRKQLSELAIHQPDAFAQVCEQAKTALAA